MVIGKAFRSFVREGPLSEKNSLAESVARSCRQFRCASSLSVRPYLALNDVIVGSRQDRGHARKTIAKQPMV